MQINFASEIYTKPAENFNKSENGYKKAFSKKMNEYPKKIQKMENALCVLKKPGLKVDRILYILKLEMQFIHIRNEWTWMKIREEAK